MPVHQSIHPQHYIDGSEGIQSHYHDADETNCGTQYSRSDYCHYVQEQVEGPMTPSGLTPANFINSHALDMCHDGSEGIHTHCNAADNPAVARIALNLNVVGTSGRARDSIRTHSSLLHQLICPEHAP